MFWSTVGGMLIPVVLLFAPSYLIATAILGA